KGDEGQSACKGGQWSDCNNPVAVVGEPCTPGDAMQTGPNQNGCGDYGTPSNALYCEDNGIWLCFPADDCQPAACKTCLETYCSDFMTVDADPVCQGELDIGTSWLENCGPDRSAYFTNLDNGCANKNVSQLNSCKFQHCVFNGTCSFY